MLSTIVHLKTKTKTMTKAKTKYSKDPTTKKNKERISNKLEGSTKRRRRKNGYLETLGEGVSLTTRSTNDAETGSTWT